jgi:hypothetical protein
VVPRKTAGNKKTDCIDSHDVLWVDVDHDRPTEPEPVLARVETVLGGLGLPASAIVYSGRAGLHLYWKLDSALPIEKIEAYNRALALKLAGDKSCCTRERILRVPGTVNEKEGGSEVRLLHMNPEPLSIELLNCLTPVPERTSVQRLALPSTRNDEELLKLEQEHSHWGELSLRAGDTLTILMFEFLMSPPRHGWRSNGYKSRSEMEAAISSRLVSKGWSDRQIAQVALLGFPHHLEWKKANPSEPDRYLSATISSARCQLLAERGLVSSPRGGKTRVAYPKIRPRQPEELTKIVELAEGQPKSDLVKSAVAEHGRTRATVYRQINDLVALGRLEERNGSVHRVDVAKSGAPSTGQLDHLSRNPAKSTTNPTGETPGLPDTEPIQAQRSRPNLYSPKKPLVVPPQRDHPPCARPRKPTRSVSRRGSDSRRSRTARQSRVR